ncbi:hypothetical protein FOLKNPGA_03748 (plasmid) [Legionella sp. PC1000]|uniref:hypothetical protein n=1 Tax=Legionella sp. PC1000 TaxID=2746060 RepID=UPI0015FB0E6B|nr:hypothetical protein [Legionella sp. PC1000]QLZ70928.1 hypothetical protein FOLKNPGA_03748 [Legionella sp. PC1000]
MLEDARKRLAGTLPISGSIGEGLEKVSPKEPEKATPKAKEPERDKQEVVEVLGTHGTLLIRK